MSERTDFEFPPEILSLIFSHLDEQDVINCSMVCLKWREETNRNEIWKRLCLMRGWAEILDQPEVWSQTTSHVEPSFQCPELREDSRLSPMCSWHVDFLQCVHLYNNWKKGNYVVQNFDPAVSEHVGHYFIPSMDLNRMLVVLGDETGGVSIWKQAKNQPEFQEYVSCFFSDAPITEIFLEGTSFVVLQLGLLQVYHKNESGKYVMSYSKAMIPNASDIILPHSSEQGLNDWFMNVYDHFNDSDFHYARAGQDPVVAFWGTVESVEFLSVKPGEKIRTLRLPFENYKINDVALGSNASLIYIALENVIVGNIILEYSLDMDYCVKQLKENSTIIRIHVNNNFLFSLSMQEVLTIWDCMKGEKCHVLPSLGVSLQGTSLGLFGDSILYQSGNKISSIMHSSGKIQMNEFEVASSSIFLTKGMGNLFILQNGKDVEVWSCVDKTMKYCIKDLLTRDDHYVAWCNDACLVLWGFQTSPILVWFW